MTSYLLSKSPLKIIYNKGFFPAFILALWFKAVLTSRSIIPRNLSFTHLCGVPSLTSPPGSSEEIKSKSSSRFSPAAFAKQKLLNFKLPRPSSRIYRDKQNPTNKYQILTVVTAEISNIN